MVVISALNLALAGFVAFRTRKLTKLEPEKRKYIMVMRVMCFIFVSVAMYRTIFVSSYPNLYSWFDFILNSPFIIRCFATFAELSFAGLIALGLLKFCKESGIKGILAYTPYVLVGCLIIAQPLAFWGLTAQQKLPFAIEELLWAVGFTATLPLVIRGLIKLKKGDTVAVKYKLFLIVLAVWSIGYLLFQAYALPFVHFADIGATGTVWEGVATYFKQRDFNTWGGIAFFIWHSGYFTICSWMAIFFMTAPGTSGSKLLLTNIKKK